MTSFPAAREARVARAAFAALGALAADTRGKLLTLEKIDGQSPRSGPREAILSATGFKPDYRGMTLTAPP